MQQLRTRAAVRAVTLMGLWAALGGPVAIRAQVADANLTGTVVDTSDAVVVDAAVELRNDATGVRFSGATDPKGIYRFLNVPTGSYTLTAHAPGFALATLKGVVLELNRTHTANLRLNVGGAAASVSVNESAPLIDTSTSAVQSTFDSRFASQLPLTAGNTGVLNLSLLSAGVSSSGGLGYGTGPSVGGQRPTNNNFMIEGVDDNNRASTGPVLIVPNEAVTELALQQNHFSPEFGHSSGGQFNTIVKSGTNEFRGSAFDYLQNRKLNALDESYARQGITTLPRFDQNRFGETFGGPLKANKLFFFQAVEAQIQGRAATSAGAVYAPTAAGLAALRSLPGLSKTNLDAFAKYVPVAAVRATDVTVVGRSIPVGIPNTVGATYSNNLRTVLSIDAHLSDRDQLRGRWIRQGGEMVEGETPLPQFYSPSNVANHVASIAHFHTFTPSLLNEFRLGFNRSNEDRSAGAAQFPGLDAFPSLGFNDLGLTVGPYMAYPQTNRSNVYQASETLSWIKGSHAVKAGYDLRKVNSTFDFVARQRGEYTYDTLERYLLDITPEWGMRAVGAMPFIGNQLSHYLFVNDEWKVRPNLTITAGLRYEFVALPEGALRQNLNSIASVPGVIDFRSPQASKREFAPRLGVAWSPGTRGRSVVRAGFGMVYDQNYHNLALNSLPPQYSTSVEAHIERPNESGFLATGGIAGAAVPVTSAPTARALTSYYIPDQQRPYAIQWTTGVQQVLGRDYQLEVRYLGTKGVHLPAQVQMNRQAGVTSAAAGLALYLSRPSMAELDALPVALDTLKAVNTMAQYGFTRAITSYQPRGNSIYHGLATQVSRRYSNGLQLLAAHTWSHNIDDSTAVVASTLLTPRRPQDFFNLSAERADSMLDHRHRFTLSSVYDFKFVRNCSSSICGAAVNGWSVAGTWMAETGTWATVRSGVDSNLNGDSVADRTMINPAGIADRSSTSIALKNSAGRTVAYVAADPTARYIQAGAGMLPNAGRNTLRLPGIANLDLSVSKKFRIAEKRLLQFRVEAYNALNHAQFVPGFTSSVDVRPRVTSGSNALLLTGNSMFNRPDLAFESNSRQLQMVLRLEF